MSGYALGLFFYLSTFLLMYFNICLCFQISMVIIFERHANIMNSTNCLSLSLCASCNNTEIFYFTLWYSYLYNTANVLIPGALCVGKAGRRWISHPHVPHRTNFDSPVTTLRAFYGGLSGVCFFTYHPYISTFFVNEATVYYQIIASVSVVTPPKQSLEKEKALFCAWYYICIKIIYDLANFL